MGGRYPFHKPEAAYFISFATVNWVKIFTQEIYFNIVLDSLTYCRKNKGMQLYAYCIMPDHIHMLFRSFDDNPSGLIRDFKSYTSKMLVKAIKENPNEERKDYLLKMFEVAGAKKSNIEKYQLWQHDNMPKECFSYKFTKQKFDYIHKNPVAAGLVFKMTDWKYSSANNYYGDNWLIEIDVIGSKIEKIK